jgi:hypothetical protein
VIELREVTAIADWLETQIGVPFVVVGGSAIARVVEVGTKDVDVLVAARDMPTVEQALDGRKDATPLDPATGTIRSTSVAVGGATIELEFIVSAHLFSGELRPEEFGEYVRRHGSEEHGGIRYARPGVVFYMRLCTEDWKMYVTSLDRDLAAGVPSSVWDEVIALAKRFGSEDKIGKRVGQAREVLGR